MNEFRKRLGERLIEQEGVGQAQSDKYRREVEKLMEKENRLFKRNRLMYWLLIPLMALMAPLFWTKMDDAVTMQDKFHFAVFGLWVFIFLSMLVGVQVAAKNALEIRKEIKELSLAIKELKEKMGRQ